MWKTISLSIVGLILLALVVMVTLDKQHTNKTIQVENQNRPEKLDRTKMIDGEIFEDSVTDKIDTLERNYQQNLKKIKDDLLEAINKGNVQLIEQQKIREEKMLKEANKFPPSPTFDISPQQRTPIQDITRPVKTLDQQRTITINNNIPATSFNNGNANNNINENRFILISGSVHLTQEKNFTKNEIVVKDSQGKIKKIIKKKTAITIPPSFMEGTLLSGLMAKTLNGASDNPDQLFIRVQAPAFLPNYVKANTTGCFVIAQGTGDLASHRIKTRLISLSCIDNSGRRLIHGKLFGFLSDADDGKNHIAGVVIHKGGAIISQAMLADFVSALGGGVAELSKPTLTSTNGILEGNSASEKDLVTGSLGKGIKGASQVYSGMLKQLISQATPTIEVGNTKKVVIFVTKPSEIEIFPLIKEEEEELL